MRPKLNGKAEFPEQMNLMEIKFGLISTDSHVAHDRTDFTSRMSAQKWGDLIPHVMEIERGGRPVEVWGTYGKPGRASELDLCNCPAFMGEPFPSYPTRWEEVPRLAYDPAERLKALDTDGVDAEVLFPNTGAPGMVFHGFGDAEFELDAVRAYNDTLSDWVRVSDRYLALAILPMLQEPTVIAREIERAVEDGHKGVNVGGGGGTGPVGLPPITHPRWDPIWDACEQLGVPVHFHAGGGFGGGWGSGATKPGSWNGYPRRQDHTVYTAGCGVGPARTIPHLIFSGITQRFPRLKFVFAENGISGFNYAIAACDHEWEIRRLWTEGITIRPSEIIRRQMYGAFWFEDEGIKTRHDIGIDNIMWESDLPHVSSFYPRSWEVVERILDGVGSEERRKMLYGNALQVYGIEPSAISDQVLIASPGKANS